MVYPDIFVICVVATHAIISFQIILLFKCPQNEITIAISIPSPITMNIFSVRN